METILKVLLVSGGLIIAAIVWSVVYGDYRYNSLSRLLDYLEKRSLQRHRDKEIKQTRKLLEKQIKDRRDKENE